METTRRGFMGAGLLSALAGGDLQRHFDNNSIPEPVKFDSLGELIHHERAVPVPKGIAKRSSEHILYHHLTLYNPNIVALWGEGTGVFAGSVTRVNLVNLDLAFEETSSVKTAHFHKQTFWVHTPKEIENILKWQGFYANHVNLGGQETYETVALDTKTGTAYVFRDEKPYMQFSLRQKE